MQTLILNEVLAVIPGRDGYFLINRKDVYIGKAIETYGEWSGLESDFLARLLKSNDYVIEVGANIGSHSIGLAKLVGPRGKVFSFEPQRACFALLQTQIALNQVTNIFANCEAVGRIRGRLWMPTINYSEVGNFGGVQLSNIKNPGGRGC